MAFESKISLLNQIEKRIGSDVSHILHETESYKDGKCPSCRFPVETTLYPHFCGNCGQALQWEANDENQL